MYLEAVGVQANCVEAIYNLGMTNIRLGLPDESLQAFEKLHTVTPNNPHVLYQVANLYEQEGKRQQAIKWFNILSTCVPTDPGLFSRLGHIFGQSNDETQSFHYHLESYRHFPSNLDVIGWLGVWFVKHEMYEKSILFFDRAAQIQPTEVKWKLMVASCHRRMGNREKAFEMYTQTRRVHPENAECRLSHSKRDYYVLNSRTYCFTCLQFSFARVVGLRYLIAISKETGKSYEQYEKELSNLNKNEESVDETEGKSLKTQPKKEGSLPTGITAVIQGDEKKKLVISSENSSLGDEEEFSDSDVNDLLS